LPALVAVVPKRHCSQFELADFNQLDQLSWLVHRLVRRLEHRFPDVAYNYVIHTAPRHCQNSSSFHWRFELFPRISTVAGFEWGSECFINPLLPEDAAHQLRTAGL
jgi:UDPglucose--hexose-1-phosphate uridylyltransferase